MSDYGMSVYWMSFEHSLYFDKLVYYFDKTFILYKTVNNARLEWIEQTFQSEFRKNYYCIPDVCVSSCAQSNLKKVSLELGGKSPLVIFSDCDLDKAVKSGLSSVFFNKGENCIAAGRLFVEESIHDEFLRRVVSCAQFTTGMPNWTQSGSD